MGRSVKKLLTMLSLLAIYKGDVIDLFEKWLPFNYSFICI